MSSILLRLGEKARNLVYSIIKLSMPTGYTLVTVSTERGVLRVYTHYEGVQVIDEIFILGQYSRGLTCDQRVIVDVGAHIGIFTLLAALNFMQRRDTQGIVISVEPASINYKLLLNNVKLNHLESYVKPLKAAVASRRSTLEIKWIGIKENVQSVTMHDILHLIRRRGYNGIDLLKMDVEGAELDILLTNNSWLDNVKRIVMELHPNIYGYKGIRRIIKELNEQGFKLKIVRRKVNTGYAAAEWMKRIQFPYLAITLPWKAAVSTFTKSLNVQYLLGSRLEELEKE